MSDTNETSERGLASMNRVAKLPVIESALNKTSEMYTKLKGSNETVNSVLTSAENTMSRAKETAQPVTSKLEGPMKKVDSVLCSSLDFVEEKIPAIKLPPGELAQKTKDALNTNVVGPAIKGMYAIGEYGKNTVASLAGFNQDKPEEVADPKK